MAKKWGCRTYYNPNPFISVSWHETLIPIPLPPFVLPVVAPHLNFSVVQGLWIGSFLSNGRHKTVRGDNLFFMGRMSDAGLFIPHISFPPSWMNILTTLFASSNSLFGTSSVTLACKNVLWGNQDCDLALTPFGRAPLSLNVACHEPISLPTDIVILWGSVYAGMSLGDLLAAFIDFAIGLATELFTKYLGMPLLKKGLSKAADSAVVKGIGDLGYAAYKKMTKKTAAQIEAKLAKELAGEATEEAGKAWYKKAASGIKQFLGFKMTTSAKKYAQKAAKVKGMQKSLRKLCHKNGKKFSAELTDLVESGSFAKDFRKQLKKIHGKKYKAWAEKNQKRFRKNSLDRIEHAEIDKDLVKFEGKPALNRQKANAPDVSADDFGFYEAPAGHRRQGAVDWSSDTELPDELGSPVGHRRQGAMDGATDASMPENFGSSRDRAPSMNEFDSEVDDFADEFGSFRRDSFDLDSEMDDIADDLAPSPGHRRQNVVDFEEEIRNYQSRELNSRMHGEFLDALKEMNDAAIRAASKETLRLMAYDGLKSLITNLLWKHIIRNGNLIHFPVKIGKWTYNVHTGPTRRFANKFYASGNYFGLSWKPTDLGLETSNSAYWDDSNDPTAPEQHENYWYGGSQNSASSSTDADYWYGNNANATGTV